MRRGIGVALIALLSFACYAGHAGENPSIVVSFRDGTSAIAISTLTDAQPMRLVRHLAFKPGTFEYGVSVD